MTELFTVTPEGGRKVRLLKPIKAHSQEILFLEFRPLRWPDYMAIGEPLIEGMSAGGVYIVEPVVDRLRQYADRLIDKDQADYLPQLGIDDTYAVLAAIRDFFDQARARQRAHKQPSPLSENTDSAPAISPA